VTRYPGTSFMVEVMTPWVSVKQAGGSSAKGLLEGLLDSLLLVDAMVGKKKRRWAVREEVGNFEAQRKYKGEIVGGKRGALQGKDRAG